MKQSITYLKQGLAFPFWLAVALLSGLSGYVAYTPDPLRATYRTEVVYIRKSAVEQVNVQQQKWPEQTDRQYFNQFNVRWHQHQQQVAFRQTTQKHHSIKTQQLQQLPYLPVQYATEPPLPTFLG
ncbi:hypothetical protein BKI52_30520 [marine bacterium AO1-C]|nr:hypothetical protein BKI52_30520 [marine bacterium AO1-C]